MNHEWKEVASRVLYQLDLHEGRLKHLEDSVDELKRQMAVMTMKYSFLGSLAASGATGIALLVWYYSK